ncbi:hypothetical protein [Paraclostridium bifermentans]|uniref:hypothetical protein n=1 Tax=Paraclostridium bifermentans TaxID=1490 RepID=UPI001C827004|nr:hypothetical protein [Paraclostridium bifermentans]GIM32968.1 hypothetical protein PAGU1678_22380 [Paraclostridium bifermentans subsp. muricolitidis]
MKITFDELDHEEIYDILDLYVLIKKYINTIHLKMEYILCEEQIEEVSAFDEYDKENGYEDDTEDECSNYEIGLKILNMIFDFAISKCKNSLKECLDMEITDLLDYIDYKLKNKEVSNEDYASE